VKASKNISAIDLKGLQSFREFHSKTNPLVIYLGDRALEKNDIPILPLKQALELIAKEL
jgi:hypothetical protein